MSEVRFCKKCGAQMMITTSGEYCPNCHYNTILYPIINISDRSDGGRQDMVNHPSHYGKEGDPYETINVIEAWDLDFCLGNAVKYISRAGKKDSAKEVEDLKKAVWYLERKIHQLEGIHQPEAEE